MDTTRRKMYLLTLLSAVVVGSYCQVTAPNKSGILGNNALTLTCSYTLDNTLTGVTWYKNVPTLNWPYFVTFLPEALGANSTVNPSLPDASLPDRLTFNRFASNTAADITFNSLQCQDATEYRCDVSVNPANTLSATMTLTLEVTPVGAPVLSSQTAAPYISGQEYTFTCGGDVGSPSGTITWYIQRTQSTEVVITQGVTDGTDSPVRTCSITRTSNLVITLQRIDDHANLYCRVEHKLLPTALQSDHVQLVVLYPVSVTGLTRFPEVSQYIIGSKVTLTCHAFGNPAPDIYWQYKPSNINEVTNVTNGIGESLVLSNLQLADSGVYSCIAENVLAGITHNASFPTNIDVVATTTPEPSTTQLSTEGPVVSTKDPTTAAATGPDTTTIIGGTLGAIGGLLVIAIIVGVYCFMTRRKKAQRIEEPPEKPRNDRQDLGYNIRPDVVTNGEKQKQPNYNNQAFDKTGEQLYYASLQFDNEPRSRKPLAGSGDTNYADISTMPRV